MSTNIPFPKSAQPVTPEDPMKKSTKPALKPIPMNKSKPKLIRTGARGFVLKALSKPGQRVKLVDLAKDMQKEMKNRSLEWCTKCIKVIGSWMVKNKKPCANLILPEVAVAKAAPKKVKPVTKKTVKSKPAITDLGI